MNEYKSLKTNNKQEYVCEFTNGYIIKTKDEKIIQCIVQGKLSFRDVLQDFSHLVISWPNKKKRTQKLRELAELKELARINEAIEKADSEHCSALERETAVEQGEEK